MCPRNRVNSKKLRERYAKWLVKELFSRGDKELAWGFFREGAKKEDRFLRGNTQSEVPSLQQAKVRRARQEKTEEAFWEEIP